MAASRETIHIYHTNDVHSHFDNWAKINRFLREQRIKHTSASDGFYLFDIGDFVDRSHPYTEGTSGRGNTQLLNEAGYDAVTIGNNEGITMSKEALNALYTNAKFDVILGNLFDEEGCIPDWAVPSHIYVTAQGTRIGVIAATAQYTQFYNQLGWQIHSGHDVLIKAAKRLAPETDFIVCLSHLGIREDEELAVMCPAIHLILGAHTHHLFMEGKFIGETLLAATGKFGQFVGHVTVQFDQHKLGEMEAICYPTDTLASTEAEERVFKKTLDVGERKLDERVFFNPSCLQQNLYGASSLAEFFGQTLITYTGADCAMFNAGIFLGNLEAGWVTKSTLHKILPHAINVCVVTLDGEALLDIYETSLNEDWPEIQVTGLGFRGKQMGAMIYECIHKDAQGILIAGNRQVVAGETYTLATLDMFTFGFFFPTLQHAEKEYLLPDLLRDIIADYGRYQFSE